MGGQQWHDEIGSALRRCDWLLLVLSGASIQSKWVKCELLFALLDDRFHDRIITILLEPCEFDRLSWTLPSLEWVDFRASFEDGCRELLRRWGLGLHNI